MSSRNDQDLEERMTYVVKLLMKLLHRLIMEAQNWIMFLVGKGTIQRKPLTVRYFCVVKPLGHRLNDFPHSAQVQMGSSSSGEQIFNKLISCLDGWKIALVSLTLYKLEKKQLWSWKTLHICHYFSKIYHVPVFLSHLMMHKVRSLCH